MKRRKTDETTGGALSLNPAVVPDSESFSLYLMRFSCLYSSVPQSWSQGGGGRLQQTSHQQRGDSTKTDFYFLGGEFDSRVTDDVKTCQISVCFLFPVQNFWALV